MPKKPAHEWPVIDIDRIWRKGHREEVVEEIGYGKWRISDLCAIVKDEPVYEVPLAFLDLRAHVFDLEKDGLIAFARHMKHVEDCDLSQPVIISPMGQILDGRHRIVKALMLGHSTIRCVRLPEGYSTTFA